MPTTTGKTNTGKKDPEGRTIWRGPRGALFVQRNGRNVQVATPTTARAASKWLGESSFTNHITLGEHKRKHGVVLRGKYYHPEGLKKWIAKGGQTVPHTGERMTNAEMKKIRDHVVLHRSSSGASSSHGTSSRSSSSHGHTSSSGTSRSSSGTSRSTGTYRGSRGWPETNSNSNTATSRARHGVTDYLPGGRYSEEYNDGQMGRVYDVMRAISHDRGNHVSLPSRLPWVTVRVVVNSQPVLYVPALMKVRELKRLLETVRGMSLRFDENREEPEHVSQYMDVNDLDDDRRVGEYANVFDIRDVFLWLKSDHWFPGHRH